MNDFRGDLAVTVRPDRITEICQTLKEDTSTRFDLLSTITGVDYQGYPEKTRDERFNVVYHLYSIDHGHRVRLKVPLPESAPEVDSVSSSMEDRELVGTRNVRHVRYPLSQSSGSSPHSLPRRVRRPRAPKGPRAGRSHDPLSRDYKLPIEYKTRMAGRRTPTGYSASLRSSTSDLRIPLLTERFESSARLDGEKMIESMSR